MFGAQGVDDVGDDLHAGHAFDAEDAVGGGVGDGGELGGGLGFQLVQVQLGVSGEGGADGVDSTGSVGAGAGGGDEGIEVHDDPPGCG
jgi:hypothetical protein